jgi:tetratricopeptide (TPR) repeat protein
MRFPAALAASIWLALGTAASLCPPVAPGQAMSVAGHAMGDMKPIPPPDQLPVPQRMTGIGNSYIPITASPEAQMWFEQGLSLMHDFWDYEAVKAFEQGVRVDPRCAMCYWGIFQEVAQRGPETKVYAAAALAQAVKLEKHVSKPERLYIEAAQAGAAEGPESQARATAIFRRLVSREPRDPEARLFLAESLGDGYTDQGEPKPGTAEKIAILQSVLRDFPDDSAANHYWIHAMEPSAHPERALASAARLASLAPNSGHMVHMPGHIYYRVGDYADAERWFAASTAVDERYMREQHVAPDDDWNYVHNLMYGIANLMEEGKLREASALSDRLAGARGQLSTTLYIWSSRDQITRIGRRLPVALRVGDWAAVARQTGPDSVPDKPNTAHLRFLAAELHDFATGMAALEENELPAAQAASARLDAGLWRQEQDQRVATANAGTTPHASPAPASAAKPQVAAMPVMPDADMSALTPALGIASLELQGGVLVAQGKIAEAKQLYAQALNQERALGYREPPVYIRPVGETEGAALMAARAYPDAVLAYKSALVDRPNSGFALYGLARAEELSGNAAAAHQDYQAFLKAWSAADPDLPQLAQARQAITTVASR